MSKRINQVEISNFKSIHHQTIEGCKRINVFIGYPNVGKSNILEALGLLYPLQIQNNEYYSLTNTCRINSSNELYQLFFNYDYKNHIAFKINDNLEVLCILERQNNFLKIELRRAENSVNNLLGTATINNNLNLGSFSKTAEISNKFPFRPIKYYEFKSNTVFQSSDSIALSAPFGNNLLDVLQREAVFRKDVSTLLKEYDLKLTINRTENSLMLLKELDENTIINIPYSHIADTLRRLIFYKAAIASNQNSTLLFEEPEAHMFPPYIRKFTGDIIYDNKNDNQYFITTHSPFVLDDFIEDAREDLAVYIVGYKNGETTIKRLSDDELNKVHKYHVDLFFNVESYLD